MKVLIATMVCLGIAVVASRFLSQHPTVQDGYDSHDSRPLDKSVLTKTVARACGDCHSNHTNWPWYSHVPPISWWIRKHVRDGREKFNFSEWTNYSARQRHDALESICGVISINRMPPASYIAMHPEAKLTTQDKMDLCFWAAKEIEHEDRLLPKQ